MVARAVNAWQGLPRVESLPLYVPPGRLGARRRGATKLQAAKRPAPRDPRMLSAILPAILAASEIFGVPPESVLSRDKHRSVARARALAIAICRAKYGWSSNETGRAFGLDHTTVLHAFHRKWDGACRELLLESRSNSSSAPDPCSPEWPGGEAAEAELLRDVEVCGL